MDTAAEAHVTTKASTVKHFKQFSDAGLYSMLGVSGGMYVWGHAVKDDHLRETGFLSGEAAIDAFVDSTMIGYAAGRSRPFTGNGKGGFFNGGSSFPSDHAAISFAIASVIAHEYPGPLTQIFSYGAASAISAARVEGHQHFISDVAVGGLMGWYLGRQVYRARSEAAEISPKNWGVFVRNEDDEIEQGAREMGSTYVPVGSWIYEAFDRIGAMGYAPREARIVRPWTRLDCARLLAEAIDNGAGEEAALAPLIGGLNTEFAHEARLMNGTDNRGAVVEDAYARFTGISGTALRDSFHFAQTIVDDNGRPYGQGANAYMGITTRAESGPLAFYLRGEYQYASAMPPYNAAAQQALATGDGLPYGWNLRSGATSRFRTIEAYAALNLSGWQLSLGQQALWQGPDRLSSMILSNNSEAMPMVRLARTTALDLPGILSFLGPVHGDLFFAREGGIHYVRLGNPAFTLTGNASQGIDPPPVVWGATFSMKPTENLELGIAHTAIIAGYGRPLNFETFVHSFSLVGNDQGVDPGKRTLEFDFSYRVPGLRDWLTVYSEAFAYDSPLDRISFERYAFTPGIYLARVPGLPKLDLRLEGVNSNLPGLSMPGYFYANMHYPQGYTNYGQIFGSWVGREGSGAAAASSYWFSARNRVTMGFRRVIADKSFFEGGQSDDFSVGVTWMLPRSMELTASSQYETWKFPLLQAEAKSDVATTLELRIFPGLRLGTR
jgi:hypothetical protein